MPLKKFLSSFNTYLKYCFHGRRHHVFRICSLNFLLLGANGKSSARLVMTMLLLPQPRPMLLRLTMLLLPQPRPMLLRLILFKTATLLVALTKSLLRVALSLTMAVWFVCRRRGIS